MNGLSEINRAAGDECSSRDPSVYIARAKQVAANKAEWGKRIANCTGDQFDTPGIDPMYTMAVQLEGRSVAYRNGHLVIA